MEFEMPRALPLLFFLNLLGQNGKFPQQPEKEELHIGFILGSESSPLSAQLYVCTYQAAEQEENELGLEPCDCEQPGTEGVVSVRVCHGGGEGSDPACLPAPGAAAIEAEKDRAAQEVPVLPTLPNSARFIAIFVATVTCSQRSDL